MTRPGSPFPLLFCRSQMALWRHPLNTWSRFALPALHRPAEPVLHRDGALAAPYFAQPVLVLGGRYSSVALQLALQLPALAAALFPRLEG